VTARGAARELQEVVMEDLMAEPRALTRAKVADMAVVVVVAAPVVEVADLEGLELPQVAGGEARHRQQDERRPNRRKSRS